MTVGINLKCNAFPVLCSASSGTDVGSTAAVTLLPLDEAERSTGSSKRPIRRYGASRARLQRTRTRMSYVRRLVLDGRQVTPDVQVPPPVCWRGPVFSAVRSEIQES